MFEITSTCRWYEVVFSNEDNWIGEGGGAMSIASLHDCLIFDTRLQVTDFSTCSLCVQTLGQFLTDWPPENPKSINIPSKLWHQLWSLQFEISDRSSSKPVWWCGMWIDHWWVPRDHDFRIRQYLHSHTLRWSGQFICLFNIPSFIRFDNSADIQSIIRYESTNSVTSVLFEAVENDLGILEDAELWTLWDRFSSAPVKASSWNAPTWATSSVITSI